MNILNETTSVWGIDLTAVQQEQFAVYSRELRAWNEKTNLTAIVDEHGIVVRHFLDSIRCALSWGNPASLIDIGAGAGFPGLPLKILQPDLRLTLVESIDKKAAFLRHMVETLALSDVVVVSARAEAVGHDPRHREQYDAATGRAVADLRVLAEYCLPLCRVGGRFFAPKGAGGAEETTQAEQAIARLGGSAPQVEQVILPGVEERTLVVVDKHSPTPAAYPRAIGVPSKRPL